MLTQVLCFFQISNVTYVENIKATIGKDNLFTASFPSFYQGSNFFPTQSAIAFTLLTFFCQQIFQQFIAMNRVSTCFRNYNTCRTIRHKHSITKFKFAGYSRKQSSCHSITCAGNVKHFHSSGRIVNDFSIIN